MFAVWEIKVVPCRKIGTAKGGTEDPCVPTPCVLESGEKGEKSDLVLVCGEGGNVEDGEMRDWIAVISVVFLYRVPVSSNANLMNSPRPGIPGQ